MTGSWDRLFGTYRAPRPGETIDCGLHGCDGPARQRTAGLLALPFAWIGTRRAV